MITRDLLKKAVETSHENCAEAPECFLTEACEELPKTIKHDISTHLRVCLDSAARDASNELDLITLMNIVTLAELYTDLSLFRKLLFAIWDGGVHVGYRLHQLEVKAKEEVAELERCHTKESE